MFGIKISSSEEKHFVVSGFRQPCHIFSAGYDGGQSVGRLTLQANSNIREQTPGLAVLSCGQETLLSFRRWHIGSRLPYPKDSLMCRPIT